MIAIRGGSGLGDSLYVQAIARHLVRQEDRIEACSNWPDVFRPLAPHGVTVSPFRRTSITRLAHYATRRDVPRTTQFEDCCITAGIKEPVDLRLDWTIGNRALADRLRAPGRLVVVVQLPRSPMDRKDGFGAELLPDCRVLQRAIDRLGGRATIVQVGKGKPLHRFAGIDIDLADQTSVSDLLDVAAVADGFLGYPSFLIPLAESFAKPALIVWSRKGLNSRHLVIRQMTPAKLLHRQSCRFAVDDDSDWDLNRNVDAFCDTLGTPALV